MNPFVHSSAAERYAKSRPYFHPLAVGKIWERLERSMPLECVVDVGCGTGQSSRALLAIAEQVIGLDVSSEMLAVAYPDPHISYQLSPAETLPLEPNSADLITVFLAFHWFDRAGFLQEVARVLKPGGYLVLVDDGFLAQMSHVYEFERTMTRLYQDHFPTPPRHREPLTPVALQQFGLEWEQQQHFHHSMRFTLPQLIGYLTTQSNFIAVLENGTRSLEDVWNQLEGELSPFFESLEGTFRFSSGLRFIRKS
jgi:ubiquinone/menaquinone biosynthesis C-methylase UbiE